jgi:hypothetical protein
VPRTAQHLLVLLLTHALAALLDERTHRAPDATAVNACSRSLR